MYPASFNASGTAPPQPDRSRRDKQPRGRAPKTGSSHKGFLIALLVLLLCAAAAAVIFLWYLPSRDSDGVDTELEARNLVRQAMLAIDDAYADTGTYDPQTMDPASLNAVAPDITFSPVDDTLAATSPQALSSDKAVDYAGTETSYAVGTVSPKGTAYGVLVDNAAGREVTYYLDGQAVEKWEQATSTDATPTSIDQTAETTNGDTGDGSTLTTAPVTGSSDLAKDIEAMTLIRDSMTTVESAYAEVGTFEPSELTVAVLQEKQPFISFVVRDSYGAATDPISKAEEMSLDYYGTATSYSLGVRSGSGTAFGITFEKNASGQLITFYVNGQVDDWSTQLVTPVVGGIFPSLG